MEHQCGASLDYKEAFSRVCLQWYLYLHVQEVASWQHQMFCSWPFGWTYMECLYKIQVLLFHSRKQKTKNKKLFNIEKPFFSISIARPTTSPFPSCWLLDHFTVLGIFILVQAALGPDIHSVPFRQHHWYNDLLIKILVCGKQGKCSSRKPCTSGSDWAACILGSVLKHQCHMLWDMEECACSVQGPGICILYKCQGAAHVGGPWTP